MKFGVRVVTYLVAAVAVAGLSAWLAVSSRIPVDVAPVAAGEPTTHLTSYDGASIAQALTLAAVAGILLVLGISHGVRDHRTERCAGTPQGYDGRHGDH